MSKNAHTLLIPHYGTSKLVKAKRIIVGSIFSVLAFIMIVITSLTGAGNDNTSVQRVHGFDWMQWTMCSVLPKPADEIYQYLNTDDLQFILKSKSVMSSGSQKVDSLMNNLLVLGTEDDFVRTNETILGRSLEAEANTPLDIPPELQAEIDALKEKIEEIQKEAVRGGYEFTSALNGGEPVNPYERFGVAGLTFTGYLGEWKYIVLDACNSAGEPKDPKAGLIYDERLEPQATWENRSNSTDIRVIQSTRGTFTQLSSAALNVIANGLFTITKLIIVLTLSIIFLSFSDIPKVMGLTDLIGGEQGFFSAFFDGIFAPLLWLAFLLTGLNMAYSGIVKRKYRDAMSQFLISLLMMFVAFIAAAMPATFISLPNNISTTGQALVVSAVGGSMTNTKGVCAKNDETVNIVSTNKVTTDVDILEEANKNIRAAVGCQFWETFLLRPWSEAQFGDNYTKLWVKDKIPENAGEGAEFIDNNNEKIVGKATVPLGGGTEINNWAIFQISTMTDAHAYLNTNYGTPARYVSDVSSDWWRIVDALSNYDEENKVDVVYKSERGDQVVKYDQQITTNIPSEYWSQWVGNNNLNRIGIVISSIVVAGIGVAVPLVLAVMSAMYSVGLALMMSFAPFMFLMATWSRTGMGIFLSWASLVINTVIKRITVGLVLIVTLVLMNSLLAMTDELSYWTILVALVVLSVVVYKSKDKLIAMFATINLGNFSLDSISGRVKEKSMKPISATANMSASLTGSALGAKATGGTMLGGLYDGAKYEAKNIAWRSDTLRPVMVQMSVTNKEQGHESINGQHCVACNAELNYVHGKFSGGLTPNGEYLCSKCYNDRIYPDATRLDLKEKNTKENNKLDWYGRRELAKNEKLRKLQEKHVAAFGNNKDILAKGSTTQNIIDTMSFGNVMIKDGKQLRVKLTPEQQSSMVKELASSISFDIAQFHNSKQAKLLDDSVKLSAPGLPSQLQPELYDGKIKQALHNGEYDYASQMYATLIVSWLKEENPGVDVDIDPDDLARKLIPPNIS